MSDALNTQQAAARSGHTYGYFRHLLRLGQGPAVAFRAGSGRGRGCFFTAADVDAWKAARSALLAA